MQRNQTAFKLDQDSKFEGYNTGEFWHENTSYDVEVLEYDDSVLVIADDGTDRNCEMINEYSILKESGSRPTSSFRVDQSLQRYLVVEDKPAEITEENIEEEIEAYVIKTLSEKGIRCDMSADTYLTSLENK